MIETIVFLFISDIFEKILIPFSITDFDYYFINYKNYQRFDYNLLNQKVAYSALIYFNPIIVRLKLFMISSTIFVI